MFEFYEVGGKVRDEFLGLKSKDFDYVAVPDASLMEQNVDILFESLRLYLLEEGFDIFLATPDKFTLRARFPKDHENSGITADFVLSRKETGYIQGTRNPIIVPGTLFDDLARRDFTCNAIAKDQHGKIIDPFSGLRDIQKKILRTPISGKITFADDPLRLIRALRFAITKDFKICNEIHMTLLYFDYWNKFNVISEDRIREELQKCFKTNSFKTLMYLEEYKGMRDYIFKRTKLWLKPTNEE